LEQIIKARRTESLKSRKNNIKLGGGKLKFSQLKATRNYNNSSKHHNKNKKNHLRLQLIYKKVMPWIIDII
jgi:hypothetical protein